ncbi:hypothetical protein [Microbacterium sp. SSM24]|uniref:hypothetical protein n=1 Tax=Microbacterium sp. SSM24 TaxID=2991714 RepID=UPI0022267CBB|nr:hypothetical protein [Microbacterium sp. SSM24]MCW3491791.1 hypothetical protein [Microbacterium sp. SSM24]
MATVAASVTVICVVAITNSLALSDSAGSPIDAAPVVVPASTQPSAQPSSVDTATPAVTPSPTPVPEPVEPETPAEPAPSSPRAEVVPAPDAQVVVPSSPKPIVETPAKPTTPSPPASLDEALAQAKASRSWDPVRAWAASRGWTDERIQALIARLERAIAERFENEGSRQTGGGDQGTNGVSDAGRAQAPATGSHEKTWGAVAGSSKERPANAGAGASDRTERNGHGAKKDRSRDSPERRDR